MDLENRVELLEKKLDGLLDFHEHYWKAALWAGQVTSCGTAFTYSFVRNEAFRHPNDTALKGSIPIIAERRMGVQ